MKDRRSVKDIASTDFLSWVAILAPVCRTEVLQLPASIDSSRFLVESLKDHPLAQYPSSGDKGLLRDLFVVLGFCFGLLGRLHSTSYQKK